MLSTKLIKNRIKSIKNTKKITKAMEMIAASKMKRAVKMVLMTRSYANLSWLTILHLSETQKKLHPLLEKQEVKKVLLILISSNRGLCGDYNIKIINKAIDSIEKHKYSSKNIDNLQKPQIITDIINMGRKGGREMIKRKYNIIADFPKPDLATSINEVKSISDLIIKYYKEKKYNKIMVAYTDYISSLKKIPRVKQLLPINIDEQDEHLGLVGLDDKVGLNKEFLYEKEKKYLKTSDGYKLEYLFEPNPEEVLNQMLPRLIEIQLYQALLESNASEHSSRMLAMRNTSQAAEEMIDDLELTYNKSRQAAITMEISEISAGTFVKNI